VSPTPAFRQKRFNPCPFDLVEKINALGHLKAPKRTLNHQSSCAARCYWVQTLDQKN
jgi:hypothetical protein